LQITCLALAAVWFYSAVTLALRYPCLQSGCAVRLQQLPWVWQLLQGRLGLSKRGARLIMIALCVKCVVLRMVQTTWRYALGAASAFTCVVWFPPCVQCLVVTGTVQVVIRCSLTLLSCVILIPCCLIVPVIRMRTPCCWGLCVVVVMRHCLRHCPAGRLGVCGGVRLPCGRT
jgi:hypothetical protein